MSTISSNTLFHFTNSADNIIKIIKTGFEPRFCLEEFITQLITGQKADKVEVAIPMTCFCDLPLSMIDSHLDFYGSYGIGLSKQWGQSKGLTPITYIHDNSTQIKYLAQVASLIFQAFKGELDFQNLPIEKNPLVALSELSAFFKPYTGEMWRKNKYEMIRFYDEREWRYVPFLNLSDIHYRLKKEEFLNEIKRASANEVIARNFPLTFEYSDIKYLIVNTESEMVALSDALDMMHDLYTEEHRKVLKTKIVSSEQIKEDF